MVFSIYFDDYIYIKYYSKEKWMIYSISNFKTLKGYSKDCFNDKN